MLKTIVMMALITNAQAAVNFPSGFKWCVATAAHQIEGGNVNSDWWEWEKVPGHIQHGDVSGAAADHWNRLEQDTALLKELHVSEYRFSVEWAKLEPSPGKWDLDAVAHYRKELDLLRKAGITPMITLHHFTLPKWFADRGGWTAADAPEHFARFAGFVIRSIAPEVKDWITINEPVVNLLQGYVSGTMPPARKGEFKDLIPPMVGMLKAHAAAYHELHRAAPGIRVGVAHHLRVFDTEEGWHPVDSYFAQKIDEAFNWAFGSAMETGRLTFDIPTLVSVDQEIPTLAATQDFVGVNYYTRDIVHVDPLSGTFTLSVPKGAPTNDLGWEIYPEGFFRTLKAAAARFPGKPVFVTENGLADSRDSLRIPFLESHLEAMSRAISEGVPVEGYCHWSLIDNFEWSLGFAPRFGLYEVNYATQARKPRASAVRFAQITMQNGY